MPNMLKDMRKKGKMIEDEEKANEDDEETKNKTMKNAKLLPYMKDNNEIP